MRIATNASTITVCLAIQDVHIHIMHILCIKMLGEKPLTLWGRDLFVPFKFDCFYVIACMYTSDVMFCSQRLLVTPCMKSVTMTTKRLSRKN